MPFLLKPSSVLSLLSLTAASVVPATLAELSAPRILDLSEPFLDEYPDNSDAAFIEQYITRDVRRFLVVDDGEIVMDYQRDTVNDDDIFGIWSATKATMAMIIGTIITSDEYDLSVDDTLGEILTGENDWAAIEDPEELAFKQNITIFELLTMTSGMTQGAEMVQVVSLNPFSEAADLANGAGINLRQSLAFHGWNANEKGNHNYLSISNILSYVILAVTGMTPREYTSVDVFPSLGIDNNKIDWRKNFQGVEASLSSLFMTARDMAKVAQLYLQKGKAAPNKQLLPEEFIKETLSHHALWEDWPYGYFWAYQEFNVNIFPNQIGEGMWCAIGGMGQGYCFNYESKRVVAYQRSNTVWDFSNKEMLDAMVAAAFSADFTFNETADPTVEEFVESGASSRSALWWILAPILALSVLGSWNVLDEFKKE